MMSGNDLTDTRRPWGRCQIDRKREGGTQSPAGDAPEDDEDDEAA
jgi:hypothetical protein